MEGTYVLTWGLSWDNITYYHGSTSRVQAVLNPTAFIAGGSLVPTKGVSLLFLPLQQPGQSAASPPLPGLPCLLPMPSPGGGQGALPSRRAPQHHQEKQPGPLGFHCKGESEGSCSERRVLISQVPHRARQEPKWDRRHTADFTQAHGEFLPAQSVLSLLCVVKG